MAVFIAMNGIPEDRKTQSTKWTAIAFVIIFQFLMGIGWMACPWLVSDVLACKPLTTYADQASSTGQRSHPSAIVTLAELQAPSANGLAPSSPSSAAASRCSESTTPSGSGHCYLALSLAYLSGSGVPSTCARL